MNIGILPSVREKEITGINRVTIGTLNALKKVDSDNKYYLLGRADWLKLDLDQINIFASDNKSIPLNYTLCTHKLDIVHSHYRPFTFNSKIKCGKILTIHDLRPLVHPEWGRKYVFDYFDGPIRKSAMEADIIISMSEYTKKEIIQYYGIAENKIKVVYSGIFINRTGSIIETNIMKKLEKEEFLLSVSGIDLNKNQNGLVKAFCLFKEKHPDCNIKLVLTGPARNDSQLQSVLEQFAEAKKDIFYAGYVSDEELTWLYHNASAFIYPSFYEGFGLPILEAMSEGKAVICSNTTSMPEVGGDAVEYCNPYELESIICAIENVILDDLKREKLKHDAKIQAQKFTYIKAAEETFKIYKMFE